MIVIRNHLISLSFQGPCGKDRPIVGLPSLLIYSYPAPELRAVSCSALWKHLLLSLPGLSVYPGQEPSPHNIGKEIVGIFIFPWLPAKYAMLATG